MSTLFEDTFGGTAGASITSRNSDSGGSWSKHASYSSADLTLATGGTAYASGTGTAVLLTNNLALTDIEIEAGATVKSNGASDAYLGIGARINASNIQWSTLGINNINVDARIGYATAGVSGGGDYTIKVPVSSFNPLYAVGSHTLKLSVKGSGTALYRGFINNREVLRIGRNQADSGRAGIFCGG